MTILGVDVSHHQNDAGPLNWAQVKASGRAFAVIKATEGTGYTDPMFAANRKAAHAAGLIVGMYHFARLGSPAAEAAYFLRAVGALQPGEFLVLDYEPNPVPSGSAAWSKAWLDAVKAQTGVSPLVYMNSYTTTRDNWSPVAANYGLWLARYDNAPATITPVPYWSAPAMKQYSDAGIVPGIAGTCDVNAFYGTTAQLLAYGKGGTPPPPTPPALGATEMRLARTPDGTIWLVTDTQAVATGDPATYTSLAKIWGDPIAVNQDDITRINAACVSAGTLAGDLRGDLKNKGKQLDALAAAVAALQSGGVDATQVAALVLAGIKAQMSADVPAPSA